jgi:hypothetical protein
LPIPAIGRRRDTCDIKSIIIRLSVGWQPNISDLGTPFRWGECQGFPESIILGNVGAAAMFCLHILRRAVAVLDPRTFAMAQKFKVDDHVSWNSEAGRVSGKIARVHTKNVNYKGYVHHASKEEPQYEIKNDKTAHIALHKGRALRRLG